MNNASKQIQVEDIADIDMANVSSTFESNIVQMIGMCSQSRFSPPLSSSTR